jgi:DNA processing protein
MTDNLLKYKIAIGLLPGIGPITAKNIIAYTGSTEGAFRETKTALMKIPGIGELTANQIIANRDVIETAEKEIRFIEKNNIKTSFFLDEDYPYLLKQIPDAPILFFYKGKMNVENRKIISIVGTRNATSEGRSNCERLIEQIAASGLNPIIVSGLAFGIDICAHKAALKNNLETYAVLGHGLDRIYPPVHIAAAREIEECGALISEFTSHSAFDRQNFLRRNRIIAGIAHATIVAESGEKGGSLVTAEIANSYNREVFAFPGRISDKYSVGCNRLIKTNKAALIENSSDIEYLLGWEQNAAKKSFQKQLFVELNDEEKKLTEVLGEEKNQTIDVICQKTEMTQGKVSSILLELEFKGIVRVLPGKIFELTGK